MTVSPRLRVSAAAACAVAFALLLSACGADTPPPAKTAAAPAPAPAATPAPPPPPPPPSPDTEEKRLASEIWVWGFPLVLTDVTREVETAGVGTNTFKHRQTLPDAATGGANPNADFLYSQAWLDLSKGPVILSVPDTKGRYYLLALLDAYTNVAGSIGKRTTGTEARRFALVGPHFKGSVPEDTTEVRLPTDLAWIFARTAVDGPADLANAIKVQEQFKLGSAATAPKKSTKGKATKAKAAPEPAAPVANVDTTRPPRDQIAAMDATRFFTRLAMLLPGNPPPKADAEMVAKLKKLGIEPGKPFNATQLDPAKQRSLEDGIRTAVAAVQGAAGGLGGADIRHGWRIDRALGRWGTEYGRRAVAAWNGIGQNAPEDAIFMSTYLDGGGKRLDGANGYVLHFPAKALPPTDGFWSLSLYDANQKFVANPKSRFNIGSTDRLKSNADGSLDIVIAAEPPAGDMEGNWLPAPKAPFNLILRVYWPKQAVLDGHWNPPGVKLVTQ